MALRTSKNSIASIKRSLQKVAEQHPDLVVEALLSTTFWIPTLQPMESYSRRGDDTDGGISSISVIFSPDADAHATVWSDIDLEHSTSNMHRYRTSMGGGGSPRTRNALLILARAIQLDNIERPEAKR